MLRKRALKPGEQGSFSFPKFATSRQQQEVYLYTDVLCRAMSPFMYRRNSCDLEKKLVFYIHLQAVAPCNAGHTRTKQTRLSLYFFCGETISAVIKVKVVQGKDGGFV